MNQMDDASRDTAPAAIMTWRERIGAGPDFPLHAPTDVERAMEAEIAELRAKVAMPVELPPLDDELRAILGRPNFACINVARHMRNVGHEIKWRAEDEQASVIHLLLGFYLQHGPVEWFDRANEYLVKGGADATEYAGAQGRTK